MAISWGPQVLTDITTGTIEGSVTVNWLCFPSAEIGSGLVEADLWLGPCHGQITLGSLEFLPGPGTFRYHFSSKAHIYSPPVGPSDTDAFTVDVAESGPPVAVSKTFTWSITGACLQERHGSEAISSEHGVVAAKECYGEDRWVLLAGATCTATCGTATQTFDLLYDAGFSYALQASIGFDPDFWETAGVSPQASFSDLTVGGEVVDLTDDYPEEKWHDGTGSNDLYAEGTNGGVAFWIDPAGVGYANIPDGVTWSATILAPFIYSFALDVVDMAGVAVPDLVVYCSGVLDEDGNAVGHTVAEWNALTFVQSKGLVSRASTPADAAGDVKFWADRDSMIALGLEVGDEGASQQADTVTLSFGHDGRLVIDGWFVSATSRSSSPYRTDIATLVHRNGVGVYGPGPALANTSWVGDGVTTPDSAGYCTVERAGGTLRLDIPSNYIARQGKVGGTGQIAVPTAYTNRQADSQLGNGSPAEGYEGVYDWRGWGYLRQGFNTPAACTITVAIEYRDDEVFTDNHLSDSTRQTEYEYSAGDTRTFTTYTPVSSGTNRTAMFDLCNPGHCFALVSRLTLTFDTVGAYKIGEPTLTLDIGDTQSTPARAAVTPHAYVKHFENFRYREGGVSAVVDGVYQRSLWWPDNYSVYANQLEAETGGMYVVVIGATSGFDLTTCYPLESYLSLMELSGDAWTAAYSSAAADDATKDGDGNTLCILSAWDLKQRVPEDGEVDAVTGLPVAIRVGQWTAARGMQYTWTSRHVVKGRIHGWVTDTGGRRSRNTSPAGTVYRRLLGGGEYSEGVGSVESDGHGYFASDSLAIIDANQALYDYAVQWAGEDTFDGAGRLRTREWAVLVGEVTGAYEVDMCKDPNAGLLYCAYTKTGGLFFTMVSDCLTDFISGVTAGASLVASSIAGPIYSPSIIMLPDRVLLLAFQQSGSLLVYRSQNQGVSWEHQTVAAIGSGMGKVHLDEQQGVVHAVGIASLTAIYQRSDDYGATLKTFNNGETYSLIAACEDTRPAIRVLPDASLVASIIVAGAVQLHKSTDGGNSWSLAVTLP